MVHTKVILKANVPGVGRAYEVKDVKPGFAQHLIASGKAERATESGVAALKDKQEAIQVARSAVKHAIVDVVEKLGGVPLEVQVKANEQGHLFEKITAEKIVRLLSEKTGIEIEPNAIKLAEPIKEVGEHTVDVSTDTWKGAITVQVVALE